MKLFIISSLIAATTAVAGLQASEVGNRQRDQQNRIAQGVHSGQLTAHETSRLENREANVNREIARDRSRNGGYLTNREKAQVNHQQNVTSRDIYRDKHNAYVQ
jgi:hypothetical protein